MANFKTHISVSTGLGIAYGGAAYALFDVPLSTSVLAGCLCGVSGMLPDLDSGPGKPLRESLAFAAAVVSVMVAKRLELLGVAAETGVLIGAMVYLFVRFGVGWFLKHYTVHRGMFHSLPAAVIVGELAFLLASGDVVALRIFKASAVVLGYLSHLVLDELYSIEWYRGRLRLKRSFGTALKMFSSRRVWPNVSTYAKLALLSYIVFYEPGWMADHRVEQAMFWKLPEQSQEKEVRPGERLLPVPPDEPGEAGEITARQLWDGIWR